MSRPRVPSLLSLIALGLTGCGEQGPPNPEGPHSTATASPYLYVWAGDADAAEGDSDFLLVVDVDPESDSYGAVLSTAPVGSAGNDPHHAEPVAPRDGLLFANGFMSNRTFLFDLSEPTAPAFVRELDPIAGYSYIHSFLRTEDGVVLATLQNGDGSRPDDVGGLAKFDARGNLVSVTSAVDSDANLPMVRPYALEIFEDIDRVVTSSFAMSMERSANVVQIWRLSDLALLKTLPLPAVPAAEGPECYSEQAFEENGCRPVQVPGHDRPFEVRRLTDDSAILNTIPCAFYRVSDLAGDPRVDLLVNWPEEFGCMVPTRVGHLYMIPNMMADQIITLDLSDPEHPVERARLTMEPHRMPHWLQADPGADRVVLTGVGHDGGMVRIYHVDTASGELTLDQRFEAAFSMNPGRWPHGPSGPAEPHAALFGRGDR
ncbi:MAG: selenium-binding protein SBP56-related protein [Longimicrobiales bacterium]|nr:selenium-binding protein SBP56-related protein [Longimicrobiales bacterium]